MDRGTERLVAVAAIVFPLLHSLTDVMEWLHGGFSPLHLWLNYLAFLPVPAVMLGLYGLQRPQIARWGLAGALLYGFAFVYFTHTTLYALTAHIPTYEQLWTRLGWVYTVHGVAMVLGGLCFGLATARARVFPRWTALLFLTGIWLNFLLALVPVPDLLQTIGTAIRNAGLVGMGWAATPSARSFHETTTTEHRSPSTSPLHRPGHPTPLSMMAVVLEVLLGIGALGGGLALMFGPRGEILPLPMSLLKGSLFTSYFAPGLILFSVLGCGPLFVAVLAWRRHQWAPLLTLVVGVALLVWMAVEIAIIGYSNTPPLQPIYIGLGVLITVVGLAWLRHGTRPAAA